MEKSVYVILINDKISGFVTTETNAQVEILKNAITESTRYEDLYSCVLTWDTYTSSNIILVYNGWSGKYTYNVKFDKINLIDMDNVKPPPKNIKQLKNCWYSVTNDKYREIHSMRIPVAIKKFKTGQLSRIFDLKSFEDTLLDKLKAKVLKKFDNESDNQFKIRQRKTFLGSETVITKHNKLIL